MLANVPTSPSHRHATTSTPTYSSASPMYSAEEVSSAERVCRSGQHAAVFNTTALCVAERSVPQTPTGKRVVDDARSGGVTSCGQRRRGCGPSPACAQPSLPGAECVLSAPSGSSATVLVMYVTPTAVDRCRLNPFQHPRPRTSLDEVAKAMSR